MVKKAIDILLIREKESYKGVKYLSSQRRFDIGSPFRAFYLEMFLAFCSFERLRMVFSKRSVAMRSVYSILLISYFVILSYVVC